MTISERYKLWSLVPANARLAANTLLAWKACWPERVLRRDADSVTLRTLSAVLAESSQPRKAVVCAASVMEKVLTFAFEHSDAARPCGFTWQDMVSQPSAGSGRRTAQTGTAPRPARHAVGRARPVSRLNDRLEVDKTYPSLTAAAADNHVSIRSVWCALHRGMRAAGYRWRYEDSD